MKLTLAAAAAVLTAAALSVPVAQAETPDERFFSLLASRGWTVEPEYRDGFVHNAHVNCEDLRLGYSWEQIRGAIMEHAPAATIENAELFLFASVTVYCPEFLPEQKPTNPTPVPVPEASAPKQAPKSSYYPNCAAARAAGVTPIYRGEPGYSSKLDRDGNGIACE
ncbi:MAG: excalibur calcium-binding domain-containing protein [Microthrixaceae bacterium]|nr:excalibur calcium-binding domain-containing protein [Microthrixaceae bacterium]